MIFEENVQWLWMFDEWSADWIDDLFSQFWPNLVYIARGFREWWTIQQFVRRKLRGAHSFRSLSPCLRNACGAQCIRCSTSLLGKPQWVAKCSSCFSVWQWPWLLDPRFTLGIKCLWTNQLNLLLYLTKQFSTAKYCPFGPVTTWQLGTADDAARELLWLPGTLGSNKSCRSKKSNALILKNLFCL